MDGACWAAPLGRVKGEVKWIPLHIREIMIISLCLTSTQDALPSYWGMGVYIPMML